MLKQLHNWQCQCAKPEPLQDLFDGERPLNFLNFFESEQLPVRLRKIPDIDDFQGDIIEFHIMAYGFGCFDRLLYNLRHFNVTSEILHLYLHKATGLTSLCGLEHLHLRLSDLASYSAQCMQRVNAAKLFPWEMKLYTPPQIIFGKALGLTEADIATSMSRVYSERFQLNANEVWLVRKHFNQPDPVRAEELASVRTTLNFARSVTAWELTNYVYPNGHQGTYPLDANN